MSRAVVGGEGRCTLEPNCHGFRFYQRLHFVLSLFRGVIQTTGVCNFGKLNYYLGARAAKEGRDATYPKLDFCKVC